LGCIFFADRREPIHEGCGKNLLFFTLRETDTDQAVDGRSNVLTHDSANRMATMSTNVAKVAVYADGRIALDGREIQIEELRSQFMNLSKDKGAVWYYREASSADPPPVATLVIQAIIDARLPVSMSSLPDFSNVVLPDGTVKPR
jgi:hypothetical protein